MQVINGLSWTKCLTSQTRAKSCIFNVAPSNRVGRCGRTHHNVWSQTYFLQLEKKKSARTVLTFYLETNEIFLESIYNVSQNVCKQYLSTEYEHIQKQVYNTLSIVSSQNLLQDKAYVLINVALLRPVSRRHSQYTQGIVTCT